MKQPDPTRLLDITSLEIPLIGLYDAPDPAPFEPLVSPRPGVRSCVFAYYSQWLEGKTLHLTRENHGCGGAGHWLWGIESRSRQEFVRFLVDDEGLKASHALMDRWLDHSRPYRPEHPHLLLGPLQPDQYPFLRSVSFLANPDQLSALILGAHYHHAPGDRPPVIAPFGSGCMELAPLFEDLDLPQAIIGATDIAMRQYLPPEVLAFTVTRPLFESLCQLDERSFLYKPFLARLKKVRGLD
jgi:hypothetical protein